MRIITFYLLEVDIWKQLTVSLIGTKTIWAQKCLFTNFVIDC